MNPYYRIDKEYNQKLEAQDAWAELADNIEDNMKWAGECLHNFRYSNEHKLQKCKSYLEDAIDTINNELERMDEDGAEGL